MPYKISFRGQQVTCDSPEELVVLIGLESGNGSPSHVETRQPKNIRSVVDAMAAEQRQLVNLIYKVFPGFTTDGRLRDEMKLSSNKKLAGILSSVSKAVNKANIAPIIRHESIRGSKGDREHRYRMEENVHAALSDGQ